MQDDVISAIATERAGLLAALARASDDDWVKPTVCTAWDVKDVLAHVVEGELNVGRVYRGELKESGFIDPEEGIARWRALPGEAVRAALWQHGTATQRVLDAMTEEIWRAQINVFGCREVRQLVRLHLFDLAVHGHDLTDALAQPAIWGPHLPFLAEFVARAAPMTLRRHALAPEGALEVRSGERRWVIDGRSGDWKLSDEQTAARVTLDHEDLVLLTTGRGSDADAAFEGDEAIGRRILESWRVV